MTASQDVRYQTFEGHQLASMGFTDAGRPVDEKAHWIRFALGEQGCCEGLACAAHFEDGSVESGVFEADNTVRFERATGSPCKRVEVSLNNGTFANESIIDSFLRGAGQ